MSPVQLRGTHADPRKVRGEVVPAILTRNESCLSLLVQQMQSLVARVEADESRLVNRSAAHALEEVQRIGNRSHDSLIRILQRRVLDESEVPVLGVMQIGKAAINQRPDKIQGQRRTLVTTQQKL